MKKINTLNKKLKFQDFYNLPLEKWNDYNFYVSLSNEMANNLEFVYTFRNKINFECLFAYCKINAQIINDFVEFYGWSSGAWKALSYNHDYHYIFTPEFINKHYMKIKCPIPYELVFIDQVNQQAKDYLSEKNMLLVYGEVPEKNYTFTVTFNK